MMASNSSLELQENPRFVRHDSKYDCLVCKEVLKEAMQTSCGHRICERCITKLFEGKSEPVMCPANEEDCEPQYRSNITPDYSCRREIKSLKVFCEYKDNGCEEVVKWKDLAKHVDDECLVLKLECPYRCGSQPMLRTELGNHQKTCPRKPKECGFKPVGCSFKEKKEPMQQLADNLLKTAMNKKANVEKMRGEVKKVTEESSFLRRKIEQLSRARLSCDREGRENAERVQDGGVQNEDILRSDDVPVQESEETGVEDNATVSDEKLKIEMESLTERVIQLERQSGSANTTDINKCNDIEVATMQKHLAQNRSKVIERRSLTEEHSGKEQARTAPELKRRIDMHDSQFEQLDLQMAELDLRFQILETASYDGTLIWKLRDYATRKQDAVQGHSISLYSQPFYTHRYGYKMCARVCLNGDGMGKGSHMSLFFVVMRGEYDNVLPWPFQQKVTMTLLEQETGQCNLSESFRPDPTSSSFRKPTTDMNIASGCPLFVSHAVLETQKYVKEDTIMIKFQVDMSNLNHP